MATIPTQARSKTLRACLLCSLVLQGSEFKRLGCPNCDEILAMRDGGFERVRTCTTTQFDGIIASIDPENSWVARWQRISKYVPGMYAVRVSGRIPEDVEMELERRGIKYRPRDGTDQE